ncbi:MAG: hypothetical protein ACREBW_06740 [Candidatus Micrarchaeaceae archaeon]
MSGTLDWPVTPELEGMILGQKYAIYAILGYIVGAVLRTAGLQFGSIIGLICFILILVDVYAMARGLRYYTAVRILLVVLAIIPLLNFVIIMVLSMRVTGKLRELGYKIGVMGVKGYKRRT